MGQMSPIFEWLIGSDVKLTPMQGHTDGFRGHCGVLMFGVDFHRKRQRKWLLFKNIYKLNNLS